MSKPLETLEEEYLEAKEAFRADPEDSDLKAEFKEAKDAFQQARISQRQEEEADPNHKRGKGLVSVENEE